MKQVKHSLMALVAMLVLPLPVLTAQSASDRQASYSVHVQRAGEMLFWVREVRLDLEAAHRIAVARFERPPFRAPQMQSLWRGGVEVHARNYKEKLARLKALTRRLEEAKTTFELALVQEVSSDRVREATEVLDVVQWFEMSYRQARLAERTGGSRALVPSVELPNVSATGR